MMDVLLIGGSNNMMNAMIDKFNKGGHRVFLLTGREERHLFYKYVFERYNYTYENEIVKDIFRSVNPDLTVFMGAYDTNFDWSSAREEIVRYTTGLMNILSAYSAVKKGRFVYFSSQEVYGFHHGKNISETEPVSPRGFKAMALVQGEEMCSNYRKAQGLDMMVLRFDYVYGIPGRGQREDNPCFRMCMEALRTNCISVNDRHAFSMLYLKDAIELAYKALTEPTPKECCYHISSMEEINELQLAQMICRRMAGKIQVINNTVGDNFRLVLDGRKYKEEYGQKIFTDYETGVAKVAQYMEGHRNFFVGSENTEGKGYTKLTHHIWTIIRKLVPFIENIIFFIPFFMLNNRAVGSQYFNKLDFYLLYVLLFAVVHGQQQAVFSGILATAGYFFRQMYERTGFDILLDYNTYVWVAQLFIVGMVVGYMKDQLRDIQDENKKEVRYLKRKMDDIADINDSNVQMKQNFEMQVINQRNSLGKIYELTSSLENYAPEQVLFSAAKVLSELMDSKSVAVYVVANEDYARLFSSTSQEARELGGSIKYSAMEALCGELKEHRVYINKDMKKDFPLMAAGVYEQEKMKFILMLWDIPWQRMTLAEANRFTVICALIRDAIVRAKQYLEALKSHRYVEGTDILNEDAFEILVKSFLDANQQGLTECELLSVPMKKEDWKSVSEKLKTVIRRTDYLGFRKNGELQILLPNTDKDGAEFVRKRLINAGIFAGEQVV